MTWVFALQLVLRARGVRPAEPNDYRIYGAQVLAPCAGEVLAAIDYLPDMQPSHADREHPAEVGNSGNTGAPLRGDPLPISFDGRFLVRGARIERP